MNPTPKINLSAIAKKKQAEKIDEVKTDLDISTENNSEAIEEAKEVIVEELKDDIVEELKDNIVEELKESLLEDKKEKEKEDAKPSLIPRISLSSIKTNKTPAEIRELNDEREEIEHEELKEELLETLEPEIQSDNSIKSDISEDNSVKSTNESENVEKSEKIETSEENVEKTVDENVAKVDLESLAEIEKKINEKVEQEVNEKIKKWTEETNEEIVDDNAEVFWNYKSEFIKKEDIIIEKVETEHKKFRERLREPKTRILLVLWLILITSGVVSGLFILDPQNHSYEKYKTVLTNNYNEFNKNYIEKAWTLDIVSVGSYNFDTYTQKKILWGETYKYKEIIYKTSDEMMLVINNEANAMKQEAERVRLEQERIAAEQARLEQQKLEAERLAKAQEAKRKEEFNKTKEVIKDILHEKYKALFWIK